MPGRRPSRSRWHRRQGCGAGWTSPEQPPLPAHGLAREKHGGSAEAGAEAGGGRATREAPGGPGLSTPNPQGPKEGGQASPPPSVTRVTAAPRGPARLPLGCAGRKSSRGSRADIKPSLRRPGRSPSPGLNEAINPGRRREGRAPHMSRRPGQRPASRAGGD